jgi:hypothetical protein
MVISTQAAGFCRNHLKGLRCPLRRGDIPGELAANHQASLANLLLLHTKRSSAQWTSQTLEVPRIDSWRAAVNKQRKVSGVRDAIRTITLYDESGEDVSYARYLPLLVHCGTPGVDPRSLRAFPFGRRVLLSTQAAGFCRNHLKGLRCPLRRGTLGMKEEQVGSTTALVDLSCDFLDLVPIDSAFVDGFADSISPGKNKSSKLPCLVIFLEPITFHISSFC